MLQVDDISVSGFRFSKGRLAKYYNMELCIYTSAVNYSLSPVAQIARFVSYKPYFLYPSRSRYKKLLLDHQSASQSNCVLPSLPKAAQKQQLPIMTEHKTFAITFIAMFNQIKCGVQQLCTPQQSDVDNFQSIPTYSREVSDKPYWLSLYRSEAYPAGYLELIQ